MAAKFFFVLCTQAIFVQHALCQYMRGPAMGYPYEGYGPCGAIASSGGTFPVTSVSPIAPTGLTVLSEAVFEGPLIVGGAAPFLSAVALEGVLPTMGIGAVSYECGNGVVGITSEVPYGPAAYGQAAYGPVPYGPTPYASAPYASAPYASAPCAPAPYASVPCAPAPFNPAVASPLYGPGMGYPAVGCGYTL